MNKTKWIIFAVLIVALFGGAIWLGKTDDTSFKGDATKIITDGPVADHTTGPDSQKVVLIEYGDYQCPACGRVEPVIKQLRQQYGDKLTFIFRNMPLTNIHPNALAAASAAEAAGMQGKFFEMHEKLYDQQTAWADVQIGQRAAVFEGYASQIGLDVEKYKADLASQDIKDKIARDRATTKALGVEARTPSFVLNGKVLPENASSDIAELTRLIEEALKAAYPELNQAPAATNEQTQPATADPAPAQ